MIDLLLSFSWSFLISVFAIPSVIYVAHVKNLLDEPNERAVHESLTPRLGGLAIFGGFLSSIMIFGEITGGVQQLLAGSIILFFIGLKDDIVSVSAFKKFFVQVLATGIVVFMGNIRITSGYGLLGIHELDPGISFALSFLIIIGITNSINLIDGLDGLAGTIVLLITIIFGYYFYRYGGSMYQPYGYIAFSLAGGILGFLRYNFHKAIVFMGDTGSLLSGFIIAVLSIQFYEMNPLESTSFFAISVIYVPIYDLTRVCLRRIINGVSPFSADRNHIHHFLSRLGFNQIQIISVLLIVNAVCIISVLLLTPYGNQYLILFLIGYSALLTFFLEFFHYWKIRSDV